MNVNDCCIVSTFLTLWLEAVCEAVVQLLTSFYSYLNELPKNIVFYQTRYWISESKTRMHRGFNRNINDSLRDFVKPTSPGKRILSCLIQVCLFLLDLYSVCWTAYLPVCYYSFYMYLESFNFRSNDEPLTWIHSETECITIKYCKINII